MPGLFLLPLLMLACGCGDALDCAMSKSNHEASIGNLGSIRSALSIYYGDMQGQYPTDLMTLTKDRKYVTSIPDVHTICINGTVHHSRSGKLTYFPSPAAADDQGGWGYVNEPTSQDFGAVFINCTHTDYMSKRFSDY
ncbi:MAG: hypothetical protein WC728_06235 [Elusimicrobiota bacterium]